MRIGSGAVRIGVTRSESKKFTSRVRVFGAERKRERERVLEIEIIERDMCFCFVGVVRDKKAFVKGYAMPKKK